jgi:pantoate--beta-alanine ligase
MNIIENPKEMQLLSLRRRQANITAALIPTMGNLHDGHLSLVTHAATLADEVIVSIYVNPTQFGPAEDFESYPRTPESDLEHLKKCGATTVFMPSHGALYPAGDSTFTRIQCPALDQMLCSISRPHFFTGVATVVTKLFNICLPEIAIFGEKDFQQLQVIRNVCRELFIPTEIIGYPIARTDTGLALSSRNSYMSEEEMKIAPLLYKTLCEIKQELESKPMLAQEDNFISSLEEHAKLALAEYGFNVDYLDVVNPNTLRKENLGPSLRIITAAYLGKTRLIDNLAAECARKASDI